MNLLNFQNVTKKYHSTTALNSVSLSIQSGEKVALLGCNGAGKSTFLSIATGLRLPSQGSVQLFESSPLKKRARCSFSFLPQTLKLPDYLKVKNVIQVIENHFDSKLQSQILERLGIDHLTNAYCHGLSGGEERKFCFALSLIGNRKLLILDEPTANIDFLSKQEVYSILEEYLQDQDRALLFSSHEMNEVEHLADRIIVLNKGKIVAEGSVSEIKKKFSPMKISFDAAKEGLIFKSAFKVNMNGTHYTLFGENSDAMVTEVVNQECDFKNLKIEQSGLEEVFSQIWKAP